MTNLALPDDFTDLLVEFADHNVEFVLVGGWALAVHGHGRGTDDMDIFIRPSAENAKRVFRALVAFGAPIAAHGITEELFSHERYGYRMGEKPLLIEILTSIDGVTFDEAADRARVVGIDGRAIPVIGRRALLKNKRAAGRPKDLADIAWLEANPEQGEEG